VTSLSANHLASILSPICLDNNDLLAMLAGSTHPAPRAVRLNPLGMRALPSKLPFSAEPIPWCPKTGRFVIADVRPAGFIQFCTGSYYAQDAGSLLPIAAADLHPGDLVCDLCASPGGKSTALLDELGGTGGLVANEPIASRVAPLLLNLARHGTTRFAVTAMDPQRLADRLEEQFDAVLVDAPCSGQSLLARSKQTAQAYSPRTIRHCALRQNRILSAAARLVRPGGHLVYSTCTYSWDENEQQVIDLIHPSEEWTIEPVPELSPWQSPPPAPEGCYRLWPHRDRCAGAFACRLRRRGHHPSHKPRSRISKTTEKIPVDVGTWSRPIIVHSEGNRCAAWVKDVPEVLTGLLGWGPEVAFRKGKTWFPAYALAMRRDGAFVADQYTELSTAEASAYLRGEPLRRPTLGWTVVTYQDQPLGWAYGSGQQLANHLPLSARIVVQETQDPITGPLGGT